MSTITKESVVVYNNQKYKVTLEVTSNNGPEGTGPIDEATITSTFAKHVADVYKKYLGPKEDIDVKISKAGETVVFDLKPGYNSYIDSHSKEDGDDAKKAYTGAMIQKAVNPYIRRAVGTAQNETGCKNAKYKYNVDSKKLKITITFSGCEVVNEESTILQEGLKENFKNVLKKIASVLHFTKKKPEDKEVEKKGKIAVSKEDQKEPLKEYVVRKDKDGKSDGKIYVGTDKEYGEILAYLTESAVKMIFDKDMHLPAKTACHGNIVTVDISEAVKQSIQASEEEAKKNPKYAKSFYKSKEDGTLENSCAYYLYKEFVSPALNAGYEAADKTIYYLAPKDQCKTHTPVNKMVVRYLENGKFEAKFTGWLERKKK